MMIQGRKELLKLGLFEDAIDADMQTQPNGLELTVERIEEFGIAAGRIDFDNKERMLPNCTEIPWVDGWIDLKPGAYRVIYNETVTIPKDMCAIGRPRSSLLRSGVAIHSAVWDAGYRGRSESLLVVYNPAGFFIKKNARVLQLVFMRLESEQEGYSGIYNHERVGVPVGYDKEKVKEALDKELIEARKAVSESLGKRAERRTQFDR